MKDCEWCDAGVFLRDCKTYALSSKQIICNVLGGNLNESMRAGFEAVYEHMVSAGRPRDEASVEAFLV
eukprot:1004328-Pelagomonas_calceolata.AAC.1